jgi:hypothetical protein
MEVCPNAEHRICVRHLYANFRNDGHRGVLLKDLLWRVAASYTQNEFYAVIRGGRGPDWAGFACFPQPAPQ